MSFGFPPLAEEEISYRQLTKTQFLVLAEESLRKNGWSVEVLSLHGITARTEPTIKNPGERIVIRLRDTNCKVTSYSLGRTFFDKGLNEKNIQTFKASLKESVKFADLEKINLSYLKLSDYISENKHPLLKVPASTEEQLKQAFHNLLPQKGLTVTSVIITMNVLIYLAMILSGIDFLTPDVMKLVDWGANIRSHTLDGEWWRLVTCTFLHYGLLHIGMNMWVLYDIGNFVESIIGKVKFIGAYLLSGIAGSITSLWWHDQVVGVGASGAIFGLFGVFLAINSTGYIDRAFNQKMQNRILFFLLFSLGIGWVVPQFDNAGHIGGLIGGVITGLFLLPNLLQRGPVILRSYPILFASFILIPSTVLVLSFTSNWSVHYNRSMDVYSENEEKAMEYYGFSEETAPEAKISFLKNTGIELWKENIDIANDIKDLYGLPPEYIKRAMLLEQYASLRKELFENLLISEEKTGKNVNNEIASLSEDIRDILIQLNPNQASYLMERAEENMRNGNYAAALEDANTLISLLPSRTSLYDFRARVYRNLQRFEDAVKDYDQIIKMEVLAAAASKSEVSSVGIYIDKGFCLSRLGKHQQAIDAYNKALEVSPDNAIAYNYRGWSYFQLNDHEKALDDYRKALKLFPGLGTTISNLGLLKYYMGEKDSATYYLKKAITYDNTLDFPHQVLGRFENSKGNDAAALVHYNDAIESDPLDANNYYLRAMTLLSLGKLEALEDIEKALALNPHDADYFRVLADIQYQLFGLRDAALMSYSTAIAMQPNEKYQYIYRSDFYLGQKMYDAALQDYQKVIMLDSAYSSAWGNSGWIKYLQGDYQATVDYSNKAIELDSTAIYAMYNLALAELNLGNTQKAKELYIDFREKDLKHDGEVNSGAISDLKDMIKDNRKVDEAASILQEVFKEEVTLP
ncbi:MAG: hypothetical protein CMO01_04610 [Thalassobius sp.]|nr:hypothetical protein [Thalassovita sp.]